MVAGHELECCKKFRIFWPGHDILGYVANEIVLVSSPFGLGEQHGD
jgi:hypothetical protein